MGQFEIKINDYKVSCMLAEDRAGIMLLSVRGSGSRIDIPEQIDSKEYHLEPYFDGILPVIGLSKKAFLGNRVLREVSLPATISWIEDWAFAQCGQLCVVEFRGEESGSLEQRLPCQSRITFGIGVFEDCPKLCQIRMGEEDLSYLLPASIHGLMAENLLRDAELGSEHWYKKWDQRLLSFLAEADDEGYTNMVLCGEEGLRKNQVEFEADQRMKKAELCMLRLMHKKYLLDEEEMIFVNYILCHTKGCETEEAWNAIVANHGDDLVYYQLLADIGAIPIESVDAMMQDLSDKHPEAKAFLIRHKQEQTAGQNVFDQFEL